MSPLSHALLVATAPARARSWRPRPVRPTHLCGSEGGGGGGRGVARAWQIFAGGATRAGRWPAHGTGSGEEGGCVSCARMRWIDPWRGSNFRENLTNFK